MARKRREYFAGGTRLVWEVDPEARTVTIYTRVKKPTILAEKDTLTYMAKMPAWKDHPRVKRA